MEGTIFYALISITVLYFLLAIFSESVKKLIGRKVCALCLAVGFTWLALLIAKFLGKEIDNLVLALLMGQTLSSIAERGNKFFEKRKLKNFWLVRILITTLGSLIVYWLLKEQFLQLFFLLGLLFFLSPFVLETIKQKEKRKASNKAFRRAVLELRKRLEDCC